MIYMTIIGYKNLLSGYKRMSGAGGGRASVSPRSQAIPLCSEEEQLRAAALRGRQSLLPGAEPLLRLPARLRCGAVRGSADRLSAEPGHPVLPRTGPRAGLFRGAFPLAAALPCTR